MPTQPHRSSPCPILTPELGFWAAVLGVDRPLGALVCAEAQDGAALGAGAGGDTLAARRRRRRNGRGHVGEEHGSWALAPPAGELALAGGGAGCALADALLAAALVGAAARQACEAATGAAGRPLRATASACMHTRDSGDCVRLALAPKDGMQASAA